MIAVIVARTHTAGRYLEPSRPPLGRRLGSFAAHDGEEEKEIPGQPGQELFFLNSKRPIIAKHLFVLIRRFQIIQSILQYTFCLVQTRARAHTTGARIASGLAQFRNNKSPGLRHTHPPSTPPLGSANGLRPSGSDLRQHPPMLRRQHTPASATPSIGQTKSYPEKWSKNSKG